MQQLVYWSQWRVLGFVLVASVIVLSLIPAPPTVPLDNGDKFEHLVAYSVLMVWFVWVYERWSTRYLTAAALAVMGMTLEFMQGWSGLRTFDTHDMIANVTGVALGLCAGYLKLPNGLLLAERLLAKAAGQRV